MAADTILRPEPALNTLWVLWYASWIVAAAWSARAKARMKTDRGGLHRIISLVGVVLLFLPSSLGDRSSRGGLLRPIFGRLWPSNTGADWVFLVLATLGFAFCWWARLHLGKLWSGFVTLKEGHRIVDTGPYGMVRHPIYSGLMFAALATAFMRANPAGFAGAALLILGFSMTARVEEGFLRGQLGAEAYNSYSRRIGMLVPRLG